MEVNEPVDRTDLSYAVEALIKEARANDLEDHEIQEVLGNYSTAVKKDRV